MIELKKNQILPLIATYLPQNPLIIEAGSFDGRDTLKLAAHWPQATIHAFEPIPEIYQLLEQNTQHVSSIHRHRYALSDTSGTAYMYVSSKPSAPEKPCQAGTLLKPKERLQFSSLEYKKMIEVPTITLDDWAKNLSITHADFLWLDLQGMALNVVQAAPFLLSTVRVIFTEVEFIEAYENQYQFAEVKQWLEAQGFVAIARDFPENPTWFFGNVLFVRGSKFKF